MTNSATAVTCIAAVVGNGFMLVVAQVHSQLDLLLADYKKPEDLLGENGILKQLTKAIGSVSV